MGEAAYPPPAPPLAAPEVKRQPTPAEERRPSPARKRTRLDLSELELAAAGPAAAGTHWERATLDGLESRLRGCGEEPKFRQVREGLLQHQCRNASAVVSFWIGSMNWKVEGSQAQMVLKDLLAPQGRKRPASEDARSHASSPELGPPHVPVMHCASASRAGRPQASPPLAPRHKVPQLEGNRKGPGPRRRTATPRPHPRGGGEGGRDSALCAGVPPVDAGANGGRPGAPLLGPCAPRPSASGARSSTSGLV